jgi:hypothetical protein
LTSEDGLNITIPFEENPQRGIRQDCTVVFDWGPHQETPDVGPIGGSLFSPHGENFPDVDDILTYLVHIGNASIAGHC